MAEVTAGLVKELREKSGAGMMDCKAALTETAGDVEAAMDWLRKKGLAKAAKKSGRVAAEGLVGVALAGQAGVMVEVNSETDFVANNGQFQELVTAVASVALTVGDDVGAILGAAHPAGGTVGDAIASAVATIGENIALRRARKLEVSDGVVASYLHAAKGEHLGKIGVLVALRSTGEPRGLREIGRQVAMHVAAMNPLAVDPSGIDPAVIEREKQILVEKNAGKPSHVLDKIVESGLKSFYKEVCLLDQIFVVDGSKTVAQALREAEGRLGSTVSVAGMVRFALGEGIERHESDFAAEVAAAAGL